MNTIERASVGIPSRSWLPLTGQLASYSLPQARGDVVAGLAAAAVLIPKWPPSTDM